MAEITIRCDDFGELPLEERPKKNLLERILPQVILTPLNDPMWLESGQAQFRDRVRNHIVNCRENTCLTSNIYEFIDVHPNDPVAAYRTIDRDGMIEAARARMSGGTIRMRTADYAECRQRMCYDLLLRGQTDRAIAAQTHLTLEEVHEVAERHNIPTIQQ